MELYTPQPDGGRLVLAWRGGDLVGAACVKVVHERFAHKLSALKLIVIAAQCRVGPIPVPLVL